MKKYDITTYEDAIAHVETAERDMRADVPDVGDADISHEAICCVISGGSGSIDPAIAIELARRELGWSKREDADLFRQHGIDVTQSTGRKA